jgi:hypothetical protein
LNFHSDYGGQRDIAVILWTITSIDPTDCRHNAVITFTDNLSSSKTGEAIMAKHRDDQHKSECGTSRYDDELLSANWNPVLELLQWSCSHTSEVASRSAPHDYSEAEADAFLGRIYAFGA